MLGTVRTDGMKGNLFISMKSSKIVNVKKHNGQGARNTRKQLLYGCDQKDTVSYTLREGLTDSTRLSLDL